MKTKLTSTCIFDFFGLQHDCWDSRIAKAFLGLMLQYINTWKDVEPWVLESIPIPCQQSFDVCNTGENFLSEAREILKKIRVSIEFCSGRTQNTAADSFNSFDSVLIILQ